MTEAAGSTAKVLTMLPRAAEAYRAAIIAGLDGKHPEARAKARLLLRDLIGPVTIVTEPSGEVWGEFETRPAAMFRRSQIRMVGVKGFVSYMRVLVKPRA